MPKRLHQLALFATLCLLVGCEPLACLVSVRTLTPDTLRERIYGADPPAVFDLRSHAEYTSGHVAGSARVTLAGIGAAVRGIPSAREVVLVCEHGHLAALAVPYVRGAGHGSVSILGGGIANWRARRLELVNHPGSELKAQGTRNLALTRWEALLTYGAGVVIKPTYMLLSLALALWLRQSKSSDLVMMRRALWAFLAGETACLFGYYLSGADTLFQPLESLHGFGMAVGIGLGAWSVFLIVDGRMLGMLQPEQACSLTKFCGKCHKRGPLICQPKRLLKAAILLTLPLTALPWCKTLLVQDSSVVVFGALVDYRWPVLNQLVELRLYPMLAFVFLTTASLVWSKSPYSRRHEWALFLGLGLLGFSLLRVLLTGTFDETPYWGEIWEELTELIGIAGVGVMLWVFRGPFGLAAAKRF